MKKKSTGLHNSTLGSFCGWLPQQKSPVHWCVSRNKWEQPTYVSSHRMSLVPFYIHTFTPTCIAPRSSFCCNCGGWFHQHSLRDWGITRHLSAWGVLLPNHLMKFKGFSSRSSSRTAHSPGPCLFLWLISALISWVHILSLKQVSTQDLCWMFVYLKAF